MLFWIIVLIAAIVGVHHFKKYLLPVLLWTYGRGPHPAEVEAQRQANQP